MLNNILESARDAQGRFKTIGKIFPAYEDDRMVVSSVREHCDLAMSYAGKAVRLRCYLQKDNARRKRLTALASFLAAIDEMSYSPFAYYENEMLVFDDNGSHTYLDVSIEEICTGTPLIRYFEECTDARQYDSALSGLAAFARRHAYNNLRLGRMSPDNVLFGVSGRPVVSRFENAARESGLDDLRNIAIMVAVAVLGGADKRVFELMPYTLRSGILVPGENLKALLADNRGLPPEPFRCIELALSKESEGDYIEKLLSAVDNAVMVAVPPAQEFSRFLDSVCAGIHVEDKAGVKRKWTFVAEMSDMLMAAFDGRQWCYLDKNAEVAIPGPFTEASDFCEGIAKVSKGEFCGVIDRSGRYILAPVYGDIELDEASNRLILTRDGLSGLARWSGEEVTTLVYDQVLPSAEAKFVVKKDGLYGYITRDGDPVTDIIYEDAESFAGGRAVVALKGRRYVIGADGKEIDEIHV